MIKFNNLFKKSKNLGESPWLHRIYNGMKSRCNNPKSTHYKNYGGRGIKVLMTFEELRTLWIRDNGYNLKQPSIDRKDNDGHYTFENCRFIELIKNIKRQNREKFYKPILQFDLQNNLIGEFSSTVEAGRKLKLDQSTICNALKGRQLTAGGFIFKYK